MSDSERLATHAPALLKALWATGVLAAFLLPSWCLCEPISAAGSGPKRTLQPATQGQMDKTYRVRRIEIKGSGNLAMNRIARACGIRTQLILKPQSLERCQEHALQTYLRAGFIRAAIQVQPQYSAVDANTRAGFVDILITVSEGPKYHIGSIEFQGNDKTRHRTVQRATGLNLGMPYDPLSIKKWVGGLNRLGLFETVKPEDVEVEFDEQDHAAYLRFHLKEK
ncbi:MAG TPA: POTRA domain-containing protein [Blastocatellia bacterium]|nr:POTRA domain-containing protein [Blastocatellia bacterium]